jgi:16S rRNA pseudouridine516 synthase
MRLDFFVAHASGMTRKNAKRCIGTGRVRVNGETQRKAALVLADDDHVTLDGEVLVLAGHRYLMLNKPPGVVCSTDDPDNPTVLGLLPSELRRDLHPAGRLDADTTGLVLLTSDGQWSHRITAPASHLPKTYRVELADALTDAACDRLEQGVQLRNETKNTRPAMVERVTPTCIRLTISEGRYHQVKRMLAAVGNRVQALHREAIGPLALDPSLAPGEFRPLTDDELEQMEGSARR